MGSLEHTFHQPRVVFAPDDKTGRGISGQRGVESSQQQESLSEPDQLLSSLQPHTQGLLGLTPEGQALEHVDDFAAFRAERRVTWGETGEVPPIAGGAPNHPPETPKQKKDDHSSDKETERKWPPGPTDIVYLDLGLNRDEDLSHDANWLVERLLTGARDYGEEFDYLQWRAAKEGIDLQAALDELAGHELVVSRKPGWIDLPRQVISSKDGRKT